VALEAAQTRNSEESEVFTGDEFCAGAVLQGFDGMC